VPHPPRRRLRRAAGPVRSGRPVGVLVTVTDAELGAMTATERRVLAARLAAASEMQERVEVPSEHGRRRRVARLLTACCLALVPWVLVWQGVCPSSTRPPTGR